MSKKISRSSNAPGVQRSGGRASGDAGPEADTTPDADATPNAEASDGEYEGELARKHGLTDREIEVLRWISEAKSDAEIGVILGISRRTVNHHVSRRLDKVGVENRVDASRLVLEARLSRKGAHTG